MTDYMHRLADALLAIEAEMRRIGIWEEQRPPMEDIMSQQPFCFDTLDIGQWLQWVFIPRMKYILEHGEALPQQSDIFPYAEECFSGYNLDSGRLLALIKEFDELVAAANRQRGGPT